MADVDLVQSGIEGLDAMLFGGIPRENQVMVGGGPGAGKSLLTFEFIYKGALAGDAGVLFAFDESPRKIINNAKEAFPKFTRIDEMVDSGMIRIEGRDLLQDAFNRYEQTGLEFGKIVSDMEATIISTHAKRVVVDSSSDFELVIKDPIVYRRSMWALAANFRRLGVTTMLTSEIHTPDRDKLIFKPEHFIFDGIILMYQTGEEARRIHALEIIKMRGYKHSFATAPYEITSDGFRVYSPELINK